MATISVRCIVDVVEAAVAFYVERLGLVVVGNVIELFQPPST